MTRHAVAQQFPRSRRGHRSRLLAALLAVPFLLRRHRRARGRARARERRRAGRREGPAGVARDARSRPSRRRSSRASTARRTRSQGEISQTRTELDGHHGRPGRRRGSASPRLETDIDRVRGRLRGPRHRARGPRPPAARASSSRRRRSATSSRERKAELGGPDPRRRTRRSGRRCWRRSCRAPRSPTCSRTMSTQLDAAEQDRALAQQIAQDRETLLALHQTVEEHPRRDQPAAPGDGGPEAEARPADGGAAQAAGAPAGPLEKAAKAALAHGARRVRASWPRTRRSCAGSIAAAAAARKRLQRRIDRLVAAQFNNGNIPSQYNGTLIWPMAGTVTQAFGCTGFSWEPPYGELRPLPQRHRHRRGLRDARSAPRAPAGSCTAAGTTPTAPTRPGS